MEYRRGLGKSARHGARLVALAALLFAVLLSFPARLAAQIPAQIPAQISAQVPDYGALFGTGGPQQSLPVAGGDAATGLSAADYARIAESAPAPMLSKAEKAVRLFRKRLIGTLKRSPGAFFLLDDAFRKGEYVDVGNVKGTVEKISLRSFQLRHHLGMLHTIPFGEIQHLTNFSRDWVMMKLPLRLTYDTDVERVRKLVKNLGLELMEDPVVGDKFLQPLKSQGVIQMDDSAMIARIKFMTKPGDQWVVRKRVFAEIRELFAREGIEFAHREVTVRIPGLPKDRELDEDEQRVVGAAARNALDVVEAEELPLTGTGGPRDDR